MAAIHDLLAQVQDEALRSRLEQEINRLNKNKKFGLVFEEHLPEYTPLYDLPVKKGSVVAKKDGSVSEMYKVMDIADGMASCCAISNKRERESISVNNLVAVAQFGEPIYPFLKPVDSICNAPDSDLWHTLIEADNYHALQLLEYLYAGKVDCIYIDPPYNTGARDWKYNNDYVDGNDGYRHSKWLSMMKRRLKLAKKLLNPADSVLIVTIDEKEYLHLGCLLEEMFPDAIIQMVTIVHNPGGAIRVDALNRVNEYAFYLFLGSAKPSKISNDFLLAKEGAKDFSKRSPIWRGLLRGGANPLRQDSPLKFYPVLVDNEGRIIGAGEPLKEDQSREYYNVPNGLVACWPIKQGGVEGRWELKLETFNERLSKGYVKAGELKKDGSRTIYYLRNAEIERLNNGELISFGLNRRGYIEIDYKDGVERATLPKTVWNSYRHNATEYGSNLLTALLGRGKFSYPKSLYAVEDSLSFIVKSKKNALILDFFAGSGTTLHAVSLLNAEDGGSRRCILVTNNEVSETEAKDLTKRGYSPGDEEWEKLGIARYVTWPRTTCSIKGVDINGQPLAGEYITSQTEVKESQRKFTQLGFISDLAPLNTQQKKQLVGLINRSGKLPQNLVGEDCPFIVSEEHEISVLFDDSRLEDYLYALDGQEHIKEFFIVTSDSRLFKNAKEQISGLLGTYKETVPVPRPMSEGFKANAIFFQLGFLDKHSVSLGRCFTSLLPVLWMKAGAVGPCPELLDAELPPLLIYPQNQFAVLLKETHYPRLLEQLAANPVIKTVYLITDSAEGFAEMASDIQKRFRITDISQLYKDYLENFRINVHREGR